MLGIKGVEQQKACMETQIKAKKRQKRKEKKIEQSIVLTQLAIYLMDITII